LRFGPLTPAEIAGALISQHEYSDGEARAAAADADGSIGRALAAQSADVADARATAQQVARTDGQDVRSRSPYRLREKSDRKEGDGREERDQLAVCLRALASLLRDLGIVAAHAGPATLANADLQAELERLAQSFDSERSLRAFAAVDQALAALERNASPKVVADWLVLQI
jgi:hypothetical protein